jgi:Fe-S-cluster containining protein
MEKKVQETFYRNGLQFECLKCGKCCTGEPGYVWLSSGDITAISIFLGIEKGLFLKKFTRTVQFFGEMRCSLIEKSDNACIFWDKLCTIYPARPYQCRSFPFWKRNLISKREWDKTAWRCPGINRGRIFSEKEIETLLENTPDYNLERMGLLYQG